MATVLANDAYTPMIPAISRRPIYMDGWETTLAADWTPNGSNSPALADWIGLDTQLKTIAGTSASVVIEWVDDDGVTIRRPFVLFGSGSSIYWGNMPDMATGVAPSAAMTIPAGSRVYMPLFSYEMQLLANTAPACVAYLVNGSQWVPVMGSSPPLYNPDGTSFILPTIDATTTATALILLCYLTKESYVVLQCTLLTGEMPWFDMPPVYNGGGSGGAPE